MRKGGDSPQGTSQQIFCDLKQPHSHIPMAIMSSLYMCHVSYWSSKIHDSMLLCEWSGGPPCHRVWFNLILLKIRRVVVQYGWELHTSQFHFILMPPLSHVYNHRQLLGHGDYDIHDGCCCWVVGDGMTSKISKITTTDVWYRLMLWRFFKWVLIYTGRKNWNIYRCNYEPRYNWQTCVCFDLS